MNSRILQQLSQDSYTLVRRIGEAADDQGVSVYLVGGVVRDLFLKRDNLDLDFVVEGNAIIFARKAAGILKAPIKVYKDFGTAAVVLNDGRALDFATARAETYAAPGCLPQVRRGSIHEDLFRRDFTVNAMALGINHSRWGQLVDPFDGLKDLRAKTIRVLHQRSFDDDATRILRAIRFEQRFGFRIKPQTLKLLKRRLARRTGDHVSAQRFFNEFRKILMEEKIFPALKRMKQLRAEKLLHPGFVLDLKILKTVQSRFDAVKKKYDLSNDYRWKIFLTAVLEGQADRVIAEFPRSLSLTAHDCKIFAQANSAIDFLSRLCKNSLSPSGVYGVLKPLAPEQCIYLLCRASRAQVLRRLDRFLKKDQFVVLAIDGNDVKVLGATGAKIGEVLKETLDRKIDTGLKSKSQEISFVRGLLNV